ncbi:hypothetical protein NL676_015682 [Syzygium grande]|nr:hypothetical protein NL676_015682 [Syzygium grande]
MNPTFGCCEPISAVRTSASSPTRTLFTASSAFSLFTVSPNNLTHCFTPMSTPILSIRGHELSVQHRDGSHELLARFVIHAGIGYYDSRR